MSGALAALIGKVDVGKLPPLVDSNGRQSLAFITCWMMTCTG